VNPMMEIHAFSGALYLLQLFEPVMVSLASSMVLNGCHPRSVVY
jgi:hypothetical protein